MTADLRALNVRFIHNLITSDVAGHDAILHEDFIYISCAGTRVSRADYTMYTDTYAREDGAWKCIQAQITPVQPAHHPPNSPPTETIVKKYVKGVARA